MLPWLAAVLLAISLVPEPAPAPQDGAELEVFADAPDVASLAATSITPSASPVTASPSPGVDADGPLNTAPGVAIAVILIGLMIWLRSRAARR